MGSGLDSVLGHIDHGIDTLRARELDNLGIQVRSEVGDRLPVPTPQGRNAIKDRMGAGDCDAIDAV